MNRKVLSVFLLSTLLSISACSKITTGHVGVRTSFNGDVDENVKGVGYHQVIIGDITPYVANEITWVLDNLTPQTKDKSTLRDLDLSYTYSVTPSKIAEFSVKYKGRDVENDNGERYPLALYVENVVRTVTSDVISKYDALEANDNREAIREAIKLNAENIFKQDGLSNDVRIHQIFVKNLMIAQTLMDSANRAINAQNDLKTKTTEVQTALQEANRLNALSKNSENIEYMRAKALTDIAEGIKEGKVNTIVVPYDFKGIVNIK